MKWEAFKKRHPKHAKKFKERLARDKSYCRRVCIDVAHLKDFNFYDSYVQSATTWRWSLELCANHVEGHVDFQYRNSRWCYRY